MRADAIAAIATPKIMTIRKARAAAVGRLALKPCGLIEMSSDGFGNPADSGGPESRGFASPGHPGFAFVDRRAGLRQVPLAQP
jgi:hypothetical protein